MAFLKISGTDISEYIQDLSITHEPVWSTNAGRTLDATFVGDIVAWKWKLQIQTIPINQNESSLISRLIESSPYFSVSFIPPNQSSDNLITVNMYTGTPSYPVYSYVKGKKRYNGMEFNFVEQ